MVRIKERYLLVNIIFPASSATAATSRELPDWIVHHQPTIEKLTPQLLLKAIKSEVAALYGDYGSGALEGHLSVKYLSLATSTFILRCSRAHCQMLWSALTFMDHVPVKDGRPCVFRVVRVSGTIRKAEEEAIKRAKKLIIAAKGEASSSTSRFLAPDEPEQVLLDDDSDEAMQDGRV